MNAAFDSKLNIFSTLSGQKKIDTSPPHAAAFFFFTFAVLPSQITEIISWPNNTLLNNTIRVNKINRF